jgi:carotenoid cleavage dioxygenase-like enzyme
MGETSSFHEINVNSLSSVCRHDMPRYFGFYMFSSHPLRDPKTGDTYNIGTSGKTGLKYNLLRIPPKQGSISAKDHFKKNGKTIASIPR